jgi:MGT family glycosyltransferase
MPQRGHFQRILPIVEGLAARGRPPVVMTHAQFRAEVLLAGGRFFDLFEKYSLEEADGISVPWASQFVSFAGHHAEALIEEVERFRPALVIYDTFAVAGPMIARRLGVPYVNVCAGHDAQPGPTMEAFSREIQVSTSDACWAAVRRLREEFGMPDTGPLCFFSNLSPHLNVYCEPPEFLPAESRATFEPLVFHGSVSPDVRGAISGESGGWFPDGAERRVYISWGTNIWKYYRPIALAALEVLAKTLADSHGVEALISLGGAEIGERALERLVRPHVRVESFVDQWSVLESADLFVTHQGLNSTHEAIFHEVPMVSYPFFSDQPGLAHRCQELGLAVALGHAPREPIEAENVQQALAQLSEDRDGFRARLAEARKWELETIAARGEVIDAILSLVGDWPRECRETVDGREGVC